MAKVLIVEDEEEFFESLARACREKDPNCEISWAKSRDSAIRFSTDEFFDLTILDQRIPTVDDALDADVNHGRAVWDELHRSSPGMPILILTALSADDIIGTVALRSRVQRIWGCAEKFCTVDHLSKSSFENFPEKIGRYFDSIHGLMDIENNILDGSNLNEQELRICRIFVRRMSGVRCEIRELSGGLSGSPVYHAVVFDAGGQKIQNAILKVGSHKMVETEHENLRLISRLPAAASPRLLEVLNFGAKDTAAIAYQLAEGYNENIFSLTQHQPQNIATALQGITDQRANWINAKTQKRISIAEVRRTVLSDDATIEILEEYNLDWLPAFEARELQVHWGCIHGDLHCENILLNDANVPVFIDYGDVKIGPLALDWMTLECSILFHPGAAIFGVDPAQRVTAENWGEPDEYSNRDNLRIFVSRCRAQAESEGLLPRELIAAAYAYILCQLKYPDTDKSLAQSLLEVLRMQFDT